MLPPLMAIVKHRTTQQRFPLDWLRLLARPLEFAFDCESVCQLLTLAMIEKAKYEEEENLLLSPV